MAETYRISNECYDGGSFGTQGGADRCAAEIRAKFGVPTTVLHTTYSIGDEYKPNLLRTLYTVKVGQYTQHGDRYNDDRMPSRTRFGGCSMSPAGARPASLDLGTLFSLLIGMVIGAALGAVANWRETIRSVTVPGAFDRVGANAFRASELRAADPRVIPYAAVAGLVLGAIYLLIRASTFPDR